MQLYKDDTQAALALIAGNMTALEYFYNTYQKPISLFLGTYCPDSALCEELVQDAFIRLWEKRAGIDPHCNMKNFLFTIAKNMAFDQLRRIKVRNNIVSHLSLVNEQTHSLMDELVYADYSRLLSATVEQMPERNREVFTLSRNENLSNLEISRQLGISVKTVEKHITGSLKLIRGFLKRHGIQASILMAILCAG